MHDGYGVGLVFDLINNILTTISLVVYTILKNIYSYLSNIDYTGIGFDIINQYSIMKQTVVSTYNNNIDKNSMINVSLEYSLYFIDYVKSLLVGYRVEPFNNNWISISYVDQCENDKKTLSFTFDETYDQLEAIHFFKDSIDIDKQYCIDFKEWYYTAKSILLKDRKVYDCLISMRIDNKYIYTVCNIDEEPFDILPNEISKVKFLSIEYTHPELKSPIVIEIDKNAYLVGNEILSCTFVKRALEYSSNIKNFDTDYLLRIMDNDLNIFELKSNEYIKLEKDTYKIIQKKCDVDEDEHDREDGDELSECGELEHSVNSDIDSDLVDADFVDSETVDDDNVVDK